MQLATITCIKLEHVFIATSIQKMMYGKQKVGGLHVGKDQV